MPRWDTAAQGTPGWVKARQGCLTASRMADAMSRTKSGGDSEKRAKLKIELLAERLTDCSVDHVVSAAMKHGMFWEATARSAYELATGNLVDLCGFALADEVDYFGASPDGLVGSDGLLEIKCPTITTHIKYLMGEGMPIEYFWQMLAQLAVTGRKWCDFVSFFPSEDDVDDIDDDLDRAFFGKITVPRDMRIKVWRFEPEPGAIAETMEGARQLLAEVDAMFERMVLGK